MTEYLIADCPDHGSKATGDARSAVAYIRLTLACKDDADHDTIEHFRWHANEGHECWTCCTRMTIDPTDIMGTETR